MPLDQLSHAQARTIAVKMHAAEGTELSKFSKFGAIEDLEKLLDEIGWECQSRDVGMARRRQLALHKYARRAGARMAIPNWSTLWDEITPVTVDMC